MALSNLSRGPPPATTEFYDEHSETGVAGYGYFSYFNGFQIVIPTPTTTTSGATSTTTGAPAIPIMTLVKDPCPSTPAAVAAACGNPGLTTPNPNPYRGLMDRRDTSRSRVDLDPAGEPSRGRRWLVLLQSRLVAPYFAQYRVLDTAGRLFGHRRLVRRRTFMAGKGSRGESFRVHSRLLASAHVQRH